MDFRHEWKHEINYADMVALRHRLSAVMQRDKNAVDGKGYVMRLFNAGSEPTTLNISTEGSVYRSDILEKRGAVINPAGIPVGAKQIITVRIEE